MDKALTVINSLETEKVIGKYAIGGAIALLFYAEPAVTFDLDIFCILPQTGVLIDLGPLYKNLEQKGYLPSGDCVEIEGIPTQFLVPPTELVKEALDNALEKVFAGVPTRVFQYEYLLAIMAETGRAKDKAKILVSLESASPDQAKLDDILSRYGLLDKWAKIVA